MMRAGTVRKMSTVKRRQVQPQYATLDQVDSPVSSRNNSVSIHLKESYGKNLIEEPEVVRSGRFFNLQKLPSRVFEEPDILSKEDDDEIHENQRDNICLVHPKSSE